MSHSPSNALPPRDLTADCRADPADAAKYAAYARIRRVQSRPHRKITVVLAGAGDYDEMNGGWHEFFPVDSPARTCALQLSNGHGVAIECIALAGNRPF